LEEIEIAKQLTIGLIERMGVKAEVEGLLKEGNLYLEIKGDQEGLSLGNMAVPSNRSRCLSTGWSIKD